MKALIVIAALVASAQTSAFWGWNDSDGYTSGNQNSRSDASGNAVMDMESMFSAGFSGRIRIQADFLGNTDGDINSNSNWANYGYDYPYYYGAPYGAPFGPPVAPPSR